MSSSAPVETELESAPDSSQSQVVGGLGPAGAESAAALQKPGICPRCNNLLINPEGIGWCRKCGYCRSLEEDGPKISVTLESAAPKTSFLGVAEFFALLQKAPPWLWTLLGGSGAIVAIGLLGGHFLPAEGLARALWSTIQVGLSVLVLLAAHTWILVVYAPKDEHLGPKDLVLAARLWTIAFRKMPETHRQLWLGSWAVTMFLTAVFVLGGFSYWFQFYKPQKLASKNLIAAAAKAVKGNKDMSLEESVQDLAKSQELTKEPDPNQTEEDNRPTVQCVIIGYTLDNEGNIESLVLAAEAGERLRFVGRVRKGFTREQSQELLKRLKGITQDKPVVGNLAFSAVWVKPLVFCEVHQDGYDDQGRLKNPTYGSVLKE